MTASGTSQSGTPAIERTDLAPGYTISRVIKGSWQLSAGHSTVDRNQAVDDMAAFVEAGVTAFDCADIYTGVEDLIGAFRRRYPEHAAKTRVHTKFVPDDDVLETLDRSYVTGIVDRSLKRLGQERLDLVQFSWWRYDADRYVEVMGWLDDERRKGKIELLGVTNFNTPALARILDAGIPVASNQLQYSLLDDRPDRAMAALCHSRGVGLLTYGTLAGGFLSERWLGVPEPTDGFDNRSLIKYKLIIDDFGGWEMFQNLLQALDIVARRHASTISAVATRFMLDRPAVAACILGARNTSHLPDTLRVFDLNLTPQDTAELEAVTAARHGPDGDVFDLERDRTGKHGRIMKYNLNRDAG